MIPVWIIYASICVSLFQDLRYHRQDNFLVRRDYPHETIQLGNEPALDASGRRHAMDDRRKVSTRWLAATVLAGLSGAALMSATVVGVRDHERAAGRRPLLVNTQKPATSAPGLLVAARKSDKLIRSIDLTTAKQTFKTATTIRAGDKEVIKVKSFARLAAPLLLAGGAFQDEIPVFNALKLLTDAGSEKGFEASPVQAADDPQAEVSLVSAELAGFNASYAAGTLADSEVAAQVREMAAVPRRQVSAIPPQILLARTMQAPAIGLPGAAAGQIAFAPTNNPFSTINVRMVEENVTPIAKIEPGKLQDMTEEKILTATKGMTLEQAIRANGGTAEQARAISTALKGVTLQENQRLRLTIATVKSEAPRQIVRVGIYGDDKIEGIVALSDRGDYVAVAAAQPTAAKPTAADDDDEDEARTGLALYNSLYETALKNDIPRPLVDDLIRIVSADSDTDFQRPVSGGDSLDLFFTDDDDGESREILFVALTAAGETKRYYRFSNPEDGSVDYFNESGQSAKKFLMRKPIVEAQMRSGFGMRRHPILGYSRMHTGVDYSNKIGTPILAAGNGTVIKAAWDSGYGRRVEIQHANGYVTTYNHMSGFARAIEPGARVRQGTIIGYLGNTGLSTGPHLHYEVIVNDRYVDPLRIRLPRGRELDGRMLAEFKREKERIDALRTKSPTATRVGALSVR
jgi:murein DD-endopeptidase MepM/ murein hydrolase activator NlpD